MKTPVSQIATDSKGENHVEGPCRERNIKVGLEA
jgi:hypothetical protein